MCKNINKKYQEINVYVVHAGATSGRSGEGGGTGVFVYTLQALQQLYSRIYVLSTLDGMDKPQAWTERMNRYWGTQLIASRFQLHSLQNHPMWIQSKSWLLTGLSSIFYSYYKYKQIERALRPVPDVWISTGNELPIGGNGIQYVHYPQISSFRAYSKKAIAVHIVARLVSNVQMNKRFLHRIVTNSHWTAAVCRARGFTNVEVLYPPVHAPDVSLPWEERTHGIVALGRLVPSKRLELTIAIIRGLKERGIDLPLNIVGPVQNTQYYQELQRAAKHLPVVFHGSLPKIEVDRMLGTFKYGIHAALDEHFGMAPAEMLVAGCLPVVHKSGGPMEIVDNRQELMFDTVEEGIERLTYLIRSPAVARSLHDDLQTHRKSFSVSLFERGIHRVVTEQLPARNKSTVIC